MRSDADPEWAAETAIRVASFIGDLRPHTLLCNLEPEPVYLDHAYGVSNSRGLTAAVRGESRITEVAVPRARKSFTFFPAGERPEPTRRLVARPGFRTFVARARAKGATILLYLASDDLGPRLDDLVDGWIVLGELDRTREEWLARDVIGRLQPPKDRRSARRDWAKARRRFLHGPSRIPSQVGAVPVVLPAEDSEAPASRFADPIRSVTASSLVRFALGVGLAMAGMIATYLLLLR